MNNIINQNFVTIDSLIEGYANMELLDKEAACEVFHPNGRFATMQERFGLIVLCCLDDRNITQKTGDMPEDCMTPVQRSAWHKLYSKAISSAQDTVEGSLLHPDVSDVPNSDPWLWGTCLKYRFVFARRAWHARFTASGGYYLLDETCKILNDMGYHVPPTVLMEIYRLATDELVWRPDTSESDLRDEISYVIKNNGFSLEPEDSRTVGRYYPDPADGQLLSRNMFEALDPWQQRDYVRALATVLVEQVSLEYDVDRILLEIHSVHPDDWYLYSAAAPKKSDGTWSVWTLNLSKGTLECGHYGLDSPIDALNGKRGTE